MSFLKFEMKSHPKNIKYANRYIKALYDECAKETLDERSALKFKGKWRKMFSFPINRPLHLEIGPGNGKHFARLCLRNKTEGFLAIELRYKAIVQTARRIKKQGSFNGKVIRYNAGFIADLFEPQELNNVYLHFPDPWLKKRRYRKHQLIQEEFCKTLYQLQCSGSFLELKTDSENYFFQALDFFKKAGYKLEICQLNLYADQHYEKGFMDTLSQFELLFFQKEIPIKKAMFMRT